MQILGSKRCLCCKLNECARPVRGSKREKVDVGVVVQWDGCGVYARKLRRRILTQPA
jgi:hypothetical protein